MMNRRLDLDVQFRFAIVVAYRRFIDRIQRGKCNIATLYLETQSLSMLLDMGVVMPSGENALFFCNTINIAAAG
jgi:hypothetical protein